MGAIGNTTNVNGSGRNYIAYCFQTVEGYSKTGTFKGNALTNGPFVYTGFKPAFVFLKGDFSTLHWPMLDNARKPNNEVFEGYNTGITIGQQAMITGQAPGKVDFTANGFKIQDGAGQTNHTVDYIYYAVAEQPFKTTTAR